jgi:hypothetical protein
MRTAIAIGVGSDDDVTEKRRLAEGREGREISGCELSDRAALPSQRSVVKRER